MKKNRLTWKQALGNAIKKEREKAELTQEKLAQAVNRSRNQIHRIEIGQSYPSMALLINIAVTCKVNPDYIMQCARRDSNPQPAGYMVAA